MSWPRATLLAGAFLVSAAPIPAQPYGWGAPFEPYGPAAYGRDPREGRIEASSFIANSAKAAELGRGVIALAPAPEAMSGADVASFEAALQQELGRAGYRTDSAEGTGQTVEYAVSHAVIQPAEGRRDPVSGGVAVGGATGGRWHGSGTGVGFGLSLDFSKPLKALVGTRLDARIRDSATHEILWEGHAEVMTRDGDKHWTPPLLAARLTAALFKGFPHPLGG